MRPIYGQMAVFIVVVCAIAIIHLNSKVNALKVQLKKAEGKPTTPVANTGFKPVKSQD